MQEPAKRKRGEGSIFTAGSDTLWISYSDRGKRYRENTRSSDAVVAQRLLKRRLAELETETYIPKASVRIDELVSDLMAEYREKQQKSLDSVEQRWRLHLQPFFGKRRASDIGTDMVRRYIAQRQVEGASPATCNRECAILKASFNLGLESSPPKVRVCPYIPTFAERNVRVGFLADQDQTKLAAECSKKGLWMRTAFALGVTYGWRLAEILGLTVAQVDLADRTVRLEVGTTKNNHGRLVSLTEECFMLLQACCVGKKPTDHVLTRGSKIVKDFRGAWQHACARSGLAKFVCGKCQHEQTTKARCKCGNRLSWRYSGLLFHDLRRTAARNLRRLGVAESVAMKITGHKTSSIFRRYDIIEQADLAAAARLLDQKAKKSNAALEGTEVSEFGQSCTKADAVATSRHKAAALSN